MMHCRILWPVERVDAPPFPSMLSWALSDSLSCLLQVTKAAAKKK